MHSFSVVIICLFVVSGDCLQAQFLNALPSGKFPAPVSVEITGAANGSVIYYTLDGSVPDNTSLLYQTPLQFDSTGVLRAVVYQNGAPVGDILQRTYLINTHHTFPVVSLLFEPAHFFDPVSGIYINFSEDIEAPAWFEFFENNTDAVVLSQPVRVEIQGGASASQPQKSLQIKPLSGEWLKWPFFDSRPYTQYKRLVLRNSGQDWMVTQFRDAFVTSLAEDLGSFTGIVQPPDLSMQAWRPSVVYLNGKYWGIYNIRERMNEHYIEQHFGVDDSDMDLIENYATAQAGDSLEWYSLFNWMLTHSCTVDSNYQYLRQQTDYQNFLDYCVLNSIIDNQDWPGNNNRRWRERTPNGTWRWLCYDFDFTFGLAQPNTGGWNTGDPSPDALGRLLDPTSGTLPNPDWSTLIFRRFWERAEFQHDFANRTADWLNTIFNTDPVIERINTFENLYSPEISQHYIRWWFGVYDDIWRQNVEKLRYFSKNRPGFIREHVRNAVPEKNEPLHITFSVDPPEAGDIQVNTLYWNNSLLPWTGEYFANIPMPVKAIAHPGWVFKSWNTPHHFSTDSVLIIPEGGIYAVTAEFEQEDSTGTNAGNADNWEVYPNPAGDQLWIKWMQGTIPDNLNYSFFDVYGKKIKDGQIPVVNGQQVYTLNMAGFIPGVYMLRINNRVVKVVKR